MTLLSHNLKQDLRKQLIGEKVKARLAGGIRKGPVRQSLKSKSALSLLLELLNQKEYQLSKDLPDLTLIEFISDSKNHKKIEAPNVRISTKLRLVLIVGKIVDMSDEEKENLMLPMKSTESENKKEDSRHQRRFKPILAKTLKDHKMNALLDLKTCRLRIQNIPYIIHNSHVIQIDESQTFLVWGDMVLGQTSSATSNPEDDLPQLTELDDQKLMSAIESGIVDNTAKVLGYDKKDNADDDLNIPDNATFTRNDVELVMENAGCSRRDAISELIYNKGDLINTIMAFTTDSSGSSPALIRLQAKQSDSAKEEDEIPQLITTTDTD